MELWVLGQPQAQMPGGEGTKIGHSAWVRKEKISE